MYKEAPRCFLAIRNWEKGKDFGPKKPSLTSQIYDFEMAEGEVIEAKNYKGLTGVKDYEIRGKSEQGFLDVAYTLTKSSGGNLTLSDGEPLKRSLEIEKITCK